MYRHSNPQVRGHGPSTVFVDGLRWNSQYDALPTYVAHADGPQIDAWPQTNRQYVLGAERFVTGSALLQAGISLRCEDKQASVLIWVFLVKSPIWTQFGPNLIIFPLY